MDKKYLIDGRCVNLVQSLDNGKYLVENVYQEEYDEEFYIDSNSPYVVNEIFDEMPTAKYHKEIGALTETINKLNEAHRKASDSLREVEAEHKERMKKFKRYEALQRLEDFIDGKITHYAILNTYRPEIVKFEDSKSEYSRDSLKLLTLFGDTKGNLEWYLNTYCDGSGGNQIVMPCQSEEEAKRAIADYLYKYCTEEKGNKEWLPSMEAINKAQSYGATIPDGLIKKVKDKTLENLKKIELEAEQKYKEAKKKRYEFK